MMAGGKLAEGCGARRSSLEHHVVNDAGEFPGFEGNNERRRHFRVDNGGKINMVPPDDAEWFKIESVYLPQNPDDIDEFEENQSIGVVTAWTKPSTFDGVDGAALIAIREAIAAGIPGNGPLGKKRSIERLGRTCCRQCFEYRRIRKIEQEAHHEDDCRLAQRRPSEKREWGEPGKQETFDRSLSWVLRLGNNL